MENIGVNVGPIRPADGSVLGVHNSFGSIIESQVDPIAIQGLRFGYQREHGQFVSRAFW